MPIYFHTESLDYNPYKPDDFTAPSAIDILTDPVKFVAQIPTDSRKDFFFSLAETKAPRRAQSKSTGETLEEWEAWTDKNWIKQDVFCIDLDAEKFKDATNVPVDLARVGEYVDCVAGVLMCDAQDLHVNLSGRGIHCYRVLSKPITDWRFFRKNKVYLVSLMKLLHQKMKEKGLPGAPDTGIYDHGRIMRLVGTQNMKEAPTRLLHCTNWQYGLKPYRLDLEKLLDLPEPLIETEPLHKRELKSYKGSLDREGILESCQFLKWTIDNPTEVKEPEGYTALQYFSHFDTTGDYARERLASWTGSTSLSTANPDAKIQHAQTASAPPFCSTVASKFPDKCAGCKVRGTMGERAHPFKIKREEFIGSAEHGYRTKPLNKDGTPSKEAGKPVYGDLLKVYNRDHHYFVSCETEEIWSYTGTHYMRTPKVRVKAWIEKTMPYKPTERERNEFYAKIMANRVKDAEEFKPLYEKTIDHLNLKNGVLNTKTKQLQAHSPEFGFKYLIPYDYDPGARAPKFMQFLSTVMDGDPERIKAIQAMFAYSIATGYAGLEAAFWVLVGGGANGKSKALDIQEAMLGGRSNTIHLKPKNFSDGDRFALSGLDGKLLCVIEEVNGKFVGNEFLGMVKDATAGGTLTVEGKGTPHWQMPNNAKVVMTTNKDVVLEDTTVGLKRRLIPIAFNVNFESDEWIGKTDADIAQKIIATELPGILNWALEGLDEVWARGGRPYVPGSAKEQLRQMVLASDSVERWASDHLVVTNDETDFVAASALYDAYKISELVDNPVSTTVFATRIRKKIAEPLREKRVKRIGDFIFRGYFGVKTKALSE